MPAEFAIPTSEAGCPGKSSRSEPAVPSAAGDPLGAITIPCPAAPAGAVMPLSTEDPSEASSATNVDPSSGIELGNGSALGVEPPVSQILPCPSSRNPVTPLGEPKFKAPKYVENR